MVPFHLFHQKFLQATLTLDSHTLQLMPSNHQHKSSQPLPFFLPRAKHQREERKKEREKGERGKEEPGRDLKKEEEGI